MSSHIYLAIDTPDLERATTIVSRVRGHVGGIKLGLEFFSANGRQGVRAMGELGLPIFLDLKFHDIPNTVGKAIQALRSLNPAILTVHAAGGRAMMEDAKAAAPAGTKVVAVTVLTSLDGDDLRSTGLDPDPHAQVERLTVLAREAGLDGVVCSGNEVAAGRKSWPDGFFVVPGCVWPSGGEGDQKRVMTPRKALDAGASILVIGRPITAAADPNQAAREIEATCKVLPQRRTESGHRRHLVPSLRAPRSTCMSWLTRVRNRSRSFPSARRPDNLWHKCRSCER
jgi:orotidine-5'-phosphate decarboxylase